MEYNQLFPFVIPYLPWALQANPYFMQYLRQPDILEQSAGMIMMTLPNDRISYY